LNFVIVRELDITEFRGIRKLAKPLKLSKFNVLIGRNNVGKTAILEALYLLTMPYRQSSVVPSSPLPPYDSYPIEFIAKTHDGIPSLIYGYAGTATLKYYLKEKIKTEFKTPRLPVVETTPKEMEVDNIEIRITTEDIKVLLNGKEVNKNNYEDFLNSLGINSGRGILSLYIPNNSDAYKALDSFVLRDEVWSWIEKEGLHRKVIKEVLEPTIYDKLTEVIIKRDKLCARKEVSENIGPLYINIDSLGEGIKRAILIYLAVEHLKPKILIWDDIEVAAHPSLIEHTLKWLAQSKRQIIVSTHSIDVLYILTQVRPKDCKIITLKKSPDDIVNYKILALDELEDYLESSIDVRKIIEDLNYESG